MRIVIVLAIFIIIQPSPISSNQKVNHTRNSKTKAPPASITWKIVDLKVKVRIEPSPSWDTPPDDYQIFTCFSHCDRRRNVAWRNRDCLGEVPAWRGEAYECRLDFRVVERPLKVKARAVWHHVTTTRLGNTNMTSSSSFSRLVRPRGGRRRIDVLEQGKYSAPVVRREGANNDDGAASGATFNLDVTSSDVTCFHDNVTYVVRVLPLRDDLAECNGDLNFEDARMIAKPRTEYKLRCKDEHRPETLAVPDLEENSSYCLMAEYRIVYRRLRRKKLRVYRSHQTFYRFDTPKKAKSMKRKIAAITSSAYVLLCLVYFMYWLRRKAANFIKKQEAFCKEQEKALFESSRADHFRPIYDVDDREPPADVIRPDVDAVTSSRDEERRSDVRSDGDDASESDVTADEVTCSGNAGTAAAGNEAALPEVGVTEKLRPTTTTRTTSGGDDSGIGSSGRHRRHGYAPRHLVTSYSSTSSSSSGGYTRKSRMLHRDVNEDRDVMIVASPPGYTSQEAAV